MKTPQTGGRLQRQVVDRSGRSANQSFDGYGVAPRGCGKCVDMAKKDHVSETPATALLKAHKV
ncbi:MAG TPA: hypothetical protein PKY40_13140, partial [Burkholderiaceae bacterium]|nr:hypothetical protein [Burkholderiaceae bacterium]